MNTAITLKRLALACALSLSAAASGAALAAGPDVYQVGVSGPFTGGSSPMGESMRNGIRLAVEEINGIGGVNGKKIELIERDDEAKPDVGGKIAQELAQKKVVATIGIVNTGVGLASIDAYQKAQVPLIVAVSTGTSLTRKFAPPAAPANYIFRVAPTLDLEARTLLADLKKNNLLRVALMADSTAYGEAGLKAFQEQAAASGVTLVATERFTIGASNMTPQVRAAKATNAQALVVWGIGPELAVIAKDKAALDWKVPLLGSWTFSMRNFIDGAGRAGEGALMPQTFIQDIGSATRNSFLLAYKRNFQTDRIPSPMSAAQGYDAMFLLYHALRQAKTSDGPAIKSALENMTARYQGVVTSYSKPFSTADHEAITANMLLMGKVHSGRVDYAYADDQKRGSLLRLKTQ